MVIWDQTGSDGMERRQVDDKKAFRRDKVGETPSENFSLKPFAETDFVRNLKCRYCAYEDVIGRVFQQLSCSARQTRTVQEPPDNDVGVGQISQCEPS